MSASASSMDSILWFGGSSDGTCFVRPGLLRSLPLTLAEEAPFDPLNV